MIHVSSIRNNDPRYFTSDRALELDGIRLGGAGWWIRGEGDTEDPDAIRKVLTTTDRSSKYGYQLIIAAPRPVSILIAIDRDSAPAIIKSHQNAVAGAVQYLEDRGVAWADRRNGESKLVSSKWEEVVSFTHGVNRRGDPHLHDHVLVGARPAESNNVLDSRGLFSHLKAADAIYRSELRSQIAERTEWVPRRTFEGVEQIEGLDLGYVKLWAGNKDFSTEAKQQWTRDQILERWATDLSRFSERGPAVLPHREKRVIDEHTFAGSFEGLEYVNRASIVKSWANAAPFGQSYKEMEIVINELYPELIDSSGYMQEAVSLSAARMTSKVREHGARPLQAKELENWRSQSRSRPGLWLGLSR